MMSIHFGYAEGRPEPFWEHKTPLGLFCMGEAGTGLNLGVP
jgi:hypothetical protein